MKRDFTRRQFLKISGITTFGIPVLGISGSKTKEISLFRSHDDSVASSVPVQWAISELTLSLQKSGYVVKEINQPDLCSKSDFCIMFGAAGSPFISQQLDRRNLSISENREALGIIPISQRLLIACGHDQRGLIYALLELADRVNYSSSLSIKKQIIERPSNIIRGINRLFVSEVEDKPWFYDKKMWPEYLTMLATQRFNRFNLSLGIGYDFLQNVTDAYFIFAYPFLLDVKGYNVHVPQLKSGEREKNMEMLQFISEQTVKRGMQFQLGLWMHGYEWLNSPNPNYTIEGVTKENHGSYCRDAIRALLQACPAISGITLRVHGESGVTEGSYTFWKMVFEGIATCGRKVEIDLHPKGIDQTMIDLAVSTGMPVVISPKYWAEHLGLPYHQADIRELEIPKAGQKTTELMKLSTGSRSFTRYGYGDLLKEDRPYKVIHRIWPGSRRLLLWGDPLSAAAYSRAFSFCGSAGMDLMEPLSFKGRRGSGIAGDRCGYKDKSLVPKYDWEKYLNTYRVWGRMQYNPETEPEVFHRFLRKQYGSAFIYIEQALAKVTRILPVILTTHGASAANNTYWPEMYFNQPMTDKIKHPYGDTPSPRIFGNVSPFDPQLFLSINDFADELIKGERSGKYSPIEAAQWMEDYADQAEKALTKSRHESVDKVSPEFRRMETDIILQIELGRFFGAKFRAGVLYGIYEKSKQPNALEESLRKYKESRDYWIKLITVAKEVYQPDITFGEQPYLRGNWSDRLAAIDEDIAVLMKKNEEIASVSTDINDKVSKAITEVLGRPSRLKVSAHHEEIKHFKSGQSQEIKISLETGPDSVCLYYRHVNQGERYRSVEMIKEGNNFKAEIPADYTNSPYPIAYYFQIRQDSEKVTLYPGFNTDLDNQPYFVIRKTV